MEPRKVDTAPVRDKDPKTRKPGDFEPPLGTKEPIVVDPPAMSCTPAPENQDARSRP